ncbi:MAG: tellurite resistance/C4-dicarboxylate transporter family protein, partial [Acidimicrobiales bacterium]
YWLPWSMVMGDRRPALRDLDGSWFMWVVGTQSLVLAGEGLIGAWHVRALNEALAEATVALWGVGVVLYLVVLVAVLFRLLLVGITPDQLKPSYWIAMGATAISVRAGAGIVSLPRRVGDFPVGQLHSFVIGVSVVLWSFGTWWIPLLALLGLWRHVLRRYPLRYEPGLWSAVFPLGMYTVASYSLGRVAGFTFMSQLAQGWVFVGLAAWAIVLLLTLVAGAKLLRLGRAGAGHA